MTKYFLYAALVSLITPILVALFGRYLNDYFVLMTWPTSLFLLSFGGQKQTIGNIIYVWSIAVGLNTVLYVLVTFIFSLFVKIFR